MQHISIDTIKTWERFYRANFINCLTGFKAVNLIASVNAVGQPNLGVFSSVVHLGSDPALIGFINRPLAAAPHTINNIKATGVYTINHIHPAIAAKAHQSSAKYPVDVNEFEAVGLTEMYLPNIAAPFVAESHVKYALSLVEIVPITHNNTFLVIGKVTDVMLADNLIQQDGFLALHQAESLASLGVDAYYTTQQLARFGYAKPDTAIVELI
jgi:flavin reductase (DIM6/NTAB) family NADH-FMN oxidoreductase RutF